MQPEIFIIIRPAYSAIFTARNCDEIRAAWLWEKISRRNVITCYWFHHAAERTFSDNLWCVWGVHSINLTLIITRPKKLLVEPIPLRRVGWMMMLGPLCIASGMSLDIVLKHRIHTSLPTSSGGLEIFNTFRTISD